VAKGQSLYVSPISPANIAPAYILHKRQIMFRARLQARPFNGAKREFLPTACQSDKKFLVEWAFRKNAETIYECKFVTTDSATG
jgi:hypothetical protein